MCIFTCVCVCVCVLACPYGVNGTTDTGLQDKVRGAEFAALALPQGIPLLLAPIRITWPQFVAFCKSFSIVTRDCAKPLMSGGGPVSLSSIKLQVTLAD